MAALLAEREIRQCEAPRGNAARHADIENDLALFDKGPRHPDVHAGAWKQVDLLRKDVLRHWGQGRADNFYFISEEMLELPLLLLAAFPDRVAKRATAGANRVQWQGGAGAIAEHSLFHLRPGQQGEHLCVAYGVRGSGGHGRNTTTVDGVAEIDLDLLQRVYPQALKQDIECQWNATQEKVEGAKVLRFCQLVLRYEPGVPVPEGLAAQYFITHLREQFSVQLERFADASGLWQRLRWLQRYAAELLPIALDDLRDQIVDTCVSAASASPIR